VVIAWGLEGLPPLVMGGLRFVLVAVIGCLFIKKPSIPWTWMITYALTLCFGQFAFLFSAMNLGMPAGLASLVLQSQALFTLVFSTILLKEHVKPFQVFALLLAAVGLWVIGYSQENSTMTALGFGLTLASASSWALGNVTNRYISQLGYKADIGLVIWSAWVPPIPFFILSYYLDGADVIYASISNISITSLLTLLYLAVMASMVGYSLWSYLMSKYPAGQVAPLTLAVPVVGLSCSAIFLNETITQNQWFGMSLVMIALIINSFGKRIVKQFKVVFITK
jgi:drug/metabolite transporter (DMT)-like permease